VGWSGDSKSWRGLLTSIEQFTMMWLRWRGAMSSRRNAGCGGWSGRTGAPGLGDVHGRVVKAGGTAGGKWHQWLPAVKKAAVVGGPGSSEQGSVWRAIEALVDDGSDSRLGCTSAMACRRTTVAEQRWSGAGAWVRKWWKAKSFGPACILYSRAMQLEKVA
jgi:hypothetical protein